MHDMKDENVSEAMDRWGKVEELLLPSTQIAYIDHSVSL